MDATVRSQPTSVEAIRLEIARQIVAGELAPGAALDERALAADFGVSRTPVREALRVLASSGLVEQHAHRKAIVTQPDQRTLSGMFAVMAHLESLCAGLSAQAMTPVQRRALEQLHAEMAVMVREGETKAYTAANEVFHNAIYEGTQNAYLAEITLNTRIRLQPFRRAQFGALGRLQASHAEHSAVVEAILRGERQAAEAAMRAHIGLVEEAWHEFAGDAQEPAAMKARQEP
ncbi:MAG: GntR family transcriptional regulator [Oricola sp.]